MFYITFPNLKFFVNLSMQLMLLLSSFGVFVEMAFSSIFLSMLSAATLKAAMKTRESKFFKYSLCYLYRINKINYDLENFVASSHESCFSFSYDMS